MYKKYMIDLLTKKNGGGNYSTPQKSWTPMYNAGTSPGANSHPHVPAMATFLQWPVNTVPWVAERLDCNHLIFTDVTIRQKS